MLESGLACRLGLSGRHPIAERYPPVKPLGGRLNSFGNSFLAAARLKMKKVSHLAGKMNVAREQSVAGNAHFLALNFGSNVDRTRLPKLLPALPHHLHKFSSDGEIHLGLYSEYEITQKCDLHRSRRDHVRPPEHLLRPLLLSRAPGQKGGCCLHALLRSERSGC